MAAFTPTPASSLLLVIDVQERFATAIPSIAADQPTGRNCRILAEAAGLLGVQRLATEQVPDKLGPTVAHLAAVLGPAPRPGKTYFSCWDDGAIRAAIAGSLASDIVLCGIEAHVCVLATAADLLAAGRRVIVAADAVDSRKPESRQTALAAMRDLGALVVPTESIVFRWQRQAGTGAFKQISALVK
jgi:nicotinamidase-related amidase